MLGARRRYAGMLAASSLPARPAEDGLGAPPLDRGATPRESRVVNLAPNRNGPEALRKGATPEKGDLLTSARRRPRISSAALRR